MRSLGPPPGVQHAIAVIAHRGASTLAPEGTLASYRKALELGCDYVELDVRTTRDGQLVCMHDRSVDRTTNGTGLVSTLTAAEIRALDAGSRFSPEFAGERVPYFEEALELCQRRIGVYLDLKEAPLPLLVQMLRRYGLVDHTVVYGGVREFRALRALEPGLRLMPGLDELLTVPGVITSVVRELGAEVLDSHLSEWDPQAVAEAHAAGAVVWVDIMGATDTEEGMRRALAMGVDGIQTDKPQLLLKVLAG